MKKPSSAAAVAALVSLSGCALPIEEFVPIIDTRGVDRSRLDIDLSECRSYALHIDPRMEALRGTLTGAALGVAVASAYRVNTNTANGLASEGALYGSFRGEAAREAQRRVVSNCLAGRGYRVIGGTYAAAPPPARVSARPVAAARAPEPARPAPIPAPVPPVDTASTPRPVFTYAKNVAAGVPPVGQDAHAAERLARAQQCNANPNAVLAAKGPGYESYTVACSNGDAMTLRCEFGNCRVLR